MNSRRINKRLRKNRITAFVVAAAVIFGCVIMVTQILDMRNKNKELEARNARLDEQIEEQLQKQEELQDEEAYVKTEQYIEEKAKSIGYVYPDEIIFRKED